MGCGIGRFKLVGRDLRTVLYVNHLSEMIWKIPLFHWRWELCGQISMGFRIGTSCLTLQGGVLWRLVALARNFLMIGLGLKTYRRILSLRDHYILIRSWRKVFVIEVFKWVNEGRRVIEGIFCVECWKCRVFALKLNYFFYLYIVKVQVRNSWS